MKYTKLSRLLGLISMVWMLYIAINYLLKLKTYSTLEPAVNVFELIVGFAAFVLLLAYYNKSKQALSLGIAFAILSWTLGDLFWYSYEIIMKNDLPYPSVGDFGFFGVYFFIAGSIGKIKNNNRHRLIISALSAFIMLIPIFLIFNGKHNVGGLIYNFIYASAITFVINRALSKYTNSYSFLFYGILFFCITDIIFIIEANIRPFTIICDMLYPSAIALMTYGVLREGDQNG